MAGSIQTYRRMFVFLKPYLGWLLLSLVISLVIISLDGISLWFLGTLPKALFDPDTMTAVAPPLSVATINEYLKYQTYRIITHYSHLPPLAMVCIMIVVAFSLKNIINLCNTLLMLALNLKIVRDMRNSLYRHLMLLPMGYYDRHKSGDMAALIVSDVYQINISMTSTFNSLIVEPLRLVLFIGLLFVINWKLTLMVFIMYPVFAFLILHIGRSVRRRSKRWLESYSSMISTLTETIAGIRAVKMFNTHELESAKFANDNETYTGKYLRAERTRAILGPLTESLAIYVTAILLWYGGSQALSGTAAFSAEDFFRFLFILFSSYQPIKKLANVNTSIQSGIAAAERVFALMHVKTEPLEVAGKTVPVSFESEITFNKVTFQYPQCSETVLQDISFSVHRGQVVAIVGSSGSGKTTILDLLPRFYDVSAGSISIDGRDIREMDLAKLRALFGIVAQETILFDDTVANNIAYGIGARDRDRIVRAAQAANALEFIEKLPQGFDTVIGERGVMLSGGQRQRLSIARALLKNPPILILDEATSALDTESERYVQNAINTLMENRTALVVAHRLSTIQHADYILVLEGGRIVEQGKHQQLLETGQRYRYLYEMQFNVHQDRA